MSYFAERVALFSVLMGVALLLAGIGFLVLVGSTLLPATRQTSYGTAAAPVGA